MSSEAAFTTAMVATIVFSCCLVLTLPVLVATVVRGRVAAAARVSALVVVLTLLAFLAASLVGTIATPLNG